MRSTYYERRFANEFVGVGRRLSAVERAAQASRRSVESGSIVVYDEDGEPVQEVGRVSDGTVGVFDLITTPPNAPTGLAAVPGTSSIAVTWPGGYSAEQPADVTIAYVGVHITQDGGAWEPDIGTEVAQIPSTGGTITIPGDADVETRVVLVAMSAAGVASPPSDEVVVTPTYLPAAIEDVVAGFEEDLAAALDGLDVPTTLDWISARLVEGDVIVTALEGQRVQISHTGIASYNDAGQITAALTAADGGLMLSGDLVLDDDGVIQAGSAANTIRVQEFDPGTGPRGYIRFSGTSYLGEATISVAAEDGMVLVGPRASEGVTRVRFNLMSAMTGVQTSIQTNAQRLDFVGFNAAVTATGNLVLDSTGDYTWVGADSDVRLEPDGYVVSSRINSTEFTGSANLAINTTTGRIVRVSSARRTKLNIQDLDIDEMLAFRMRPRSWTDKGDMERWEADPENEPLPLRRIVGVVAEELLEAGGGALVEFFDGDPGSVDYDRLVMPVILALQYLLRRIDATDENLATLLEGPS